jgi:hypothetical protein
MDRRQLLQIGGSLIAFGAASTTSVSANPGRGQGQGSQPDKAHRGNSLSSEATPIDDVEIEVEQSNPEANNFDEEFTYYVLRYEEIAYDRYVYREPARLGGQNTVTDYTGEQTSSAFWFGVSGPGEDGIQDQIVHDGKVTQYYQTEDGWKSLVAEFNGGELLSVNGVDDF